MNPASDAPPPRHRSGLRDVILVAAAAVLIGSLYAWCLTTNDLGPQGFPFRWRYYPLQVEGWLQGRLDLPMEIPKGLLDLPDPHDPKTNSQFRFGEHGMHDLTLFDGKLYMYWGPTPAFVAFLPWRLITGTGLPTPWGAWLFVFGGWLASAVFLVRLARRCFPEARAFLLFVTLLALGVCNWGAVVLRRGDVYETAIGAAFFFVAVAWCCLAECLWAEGSRRAAWLTAAGVAYGLAIGARPNCIFGAGVLLIPWLIDRREGHRINHAIGALLQVTAAVATLLLLNYLRFGNPLDFGQRNQLAGVHLSNVAFFSPGYAFFNARTYLFSLPRWGEYFPFILPPGNPVLPSGYLGTEGAYGLFTTLPFLGLGGFVWFARGHRRLMAVAAILLVSFVSAFVILLGFVGAATRYELEMAPALALLAAIGVLAWEQRAAMHTGPRVLGRFVWIGALLVSTFTTMSASWRYDSLFSITDPAAFTRLARVANLAAVGLGFAPTNGLQSVELEVKFPATVEPDRKPEVLISTGADGSHDAVIFEYPEVGTVRVGIGHGRQTQFFPPVALDRAAPHRLKITLGSFLPPAAHPFWRRAEPDVVQRARQVVKITLDDREVFSGSARLYEPVRVHPALGGLIDPQLSFAPFSGTIIQQKEFWVTAP